VYDRSKIQIFSRFSRSAIAVLLLAPTPRQ
jgi:hypothetical protein